METLVPALTPLQSDVLELLSSGYSVPEIAERKGFTRQRAQEIIEVLRGKGLLSELPAPGTVAHVSPMWPPAPRYACWEQFVLRSATLPREDGTALPDAAPNELVLVWTRNGWPRDLGWSVTVPRRRRWSAADTRDTYADWRWWVDHSRTELARRRGVYTLPVLDDVAVRGLTRNIAWVLDTESVLMAPEQDSAGAGV
jgi:hypothetical protein